MKLRMREIGLALGLLVAMGSAAHAVPALQLYIEGATYDTDSESWVVSSTDFRLWVIGNVGQVGTIENVQLSAAFLTSEIGTGSISLTQGTSNLVTDPSISAAPSLVAGVGGDGTLPVMSDGHTLPSHGIYGTGTSFQQWAIGDFNLTDSPIGDFSNNFPTSFPENGQINVYRVVMTGFTMVHFDAFNHVEGANHALKAPFSHDATASPVPEPGSLMLLGAGLLGTTLVWRKKRS